MRGGVRHYLLKRYAGLSYTYFTSVTQVYCDERI